MRQEGERFLKEQITRMHVAVIGDIMLDKYISGQVSRISPEAPVPVNLVRTERSVLGGAANTAHNLAALGCHVYIAGVSLYAGRIQDHYQSPYSGRTAADDAS